MYPNVENMIIVPNHTQNGDYCENPSLTHYYKEICEMKSFFSESKASNIMFPNVENMIIVPNHKKNVDCYENPSLTHFMDELWL